MHGTLYMYKKAKCRCSECRAANARWGRGYNPNWSLENKHRRAVYSRRSSLLTRYGMTLEEHAELVEACDNRCHVCGLPPNTASKNHDKLHIDHDHGSNIVRGLLCNQCNRAIGLMKDDPVRLQAAADYLEGHRRGKVAV